MNQVRFFKSTSVTETVLLIMFFKKSSYYTYFSVYIASSRLLYIFFPCGPSTSLYVPVPIRQMSLGTRQSRIVKAGRINVIYRPCHRLKMKITTENDGMKEVHREIKYLFFKQKRSTEGCSKFKSPETRQVYERLVSTLEHMQVPKRDTTRRPKDKRHLSACPTRCRCSMETNVWWNDWAWYMGQVRKLFTNQIF